LPGSEQSSNNSASRATENCDSPPHLKAYVAVHGASVGKVQLAFRAGGEGINNQRALVRPPSVYRSFPDAGIGRNSFNRQVGEASFLQQIHRAAQNGLTGMFAAWTARRTLAAIGRRRFQYWLAEDLPHDSP
jgi:hypothetical protein